mmetsp:Transcript_14887/g.41242  ORF Transcript_14887/g.41242 Transcript_14887/m.41242 type:complete len:117 (-) Transcript_14887:408-758(-)
MLGNGSIGLFLLPYSTRISTLLQNSVHASLYFHSRSLLLTAFSSTPRIDSGFLGKRFQDAALRQHFWDGILEGPLLAQDVELAQERRRHPTATPNIQHFQMQQQLRYGQENFGPIL